MTIRKRRLGYRAACALLIGVTGAMSLMLATGASGSPEGASGTLQLDATLTTYWRLGREHCPPGLPAVADCAHVVGEGQIAGLGHAKATFTSILPGNDENCVVIPFNTAVIEVAGKGTLDLSRDGKICAGPAPREDGPWEYTVTGGSGRYTGASGRLSYRASVSALDGACQCGTARITWTGTLDVPGLEFDLTPPVLSGAVAKAVRVPKKAKRVRVRYSVTAQDTVDGSVPVACEPRSGSFFKLGRTRVACSATDESGNTRRAQFTVTVKRRA